MAQARPLQLRVRELAPERGTSRPPSTAAALTRPGLAERALAALTIFLLEFELPDTWFRRQQDSIRGELNLGGDTEILVLFLLLFGLAFSRLLNNGDLVLKVLARDRLLTAFVGWVALSTLWSAAPGVSFRRSVALAMAAGFAGYLVIRFTVRQILAMTSAAFAVGTALSVLFIFALPSSGNSDVGWIGIFVNKNVLGRHEVLAFLIYLVTAAAIPRWRMPLRALALVSGALVVGSTSATSLVALLAVIGNYYVYRVFRARKTLFGAVAVSFLGTAAAAVGVAYTNLGAVTGALGKDITLTGRTELWEVSFAAAGERPFLGWGWDAYWRGFFSPSHELWVQLPWLPPHAHNAFLDYLLVIGIPGTLLFAALIARGVVRASRYIRDNADPASLFPLMMLTYGFLFSLSEAGVVGRHMRWVLFVVALLMVGENWRTRSGPARPS